MTELNHELTICSYNFEFFDHEFQKEYEHEMNTNNKHEIFSSETLPPLLSLTFNQTTYKITVTIMNTTFIALIYNIIVSVTSHSHQNDVILIENCVFEFNLYSILRLLL